MSYLQIFSSFDTSLIPIKLSNLVMGRADCIKKSSKVTGHDRNHGKKLQYSVFIQTAYATEDMESAIRIVF
ncbi:hypothetical protein CI610_01190 [invertebrate metagenome]|uniref:Uncharacterized protein n=1 Tax=invertebrate metagenome TaxID=1711999 RepID=A0A2H9T9G3_9ZZZZ